MNYYFKVLRTFSFKGRARRAEYWWFVLFNAIAQLACRMVSIALGLVINTDGDAGFVLNHDYNSDSAGLLELIYGLLTLIQTIAVNVRRLHDRSLSGWWLVVGTIVIMLAAGWEAYDSGYRGISLGVVGVLGLAFLVLTVLPGPSKPNKYGPDPKADPTEETAQTFA